MFPNGVVLLMAEKDEALYEELLKKLVKITDEELEDWKGNYRKGMDANGYVAMDSDGGKWQMVVFLCNEDWKSTIVHESLHAVEQLCNHRNIPICKQTEELRAMMIGEIHSKIQEAIKI